MEKNAYDVVFTKEKWHLSDRLMKEISQAIVQEAELLSEAEPEREKKEWREISDILKRAEFAALRHIRVSQRNFHFEDPEMQRFAFGELCTALNDCKTVQQLTVSGFDARTVLVEDDDKKFEVSVFEYLLTDLTVQTSLKLIIEGCSIDAKFLEYVVFMIQAQEVNINRFEQAEVGKQEDKSLEEMGHIIKQATLLYESAWISFKCVDLTSAFEGLQESIANSFREFISSGKIELIDCDMPKLYHQAQQKVGLT